MSRKSKKLLRRRNSPPDGPWIWLTQELVDSAAWRTAPINTKRFVERLMIEHMSHAGLENGLLPCTFNDCVQWGIGRRFVEQAQADAIRRGLVYRTQKGRRHSRKLGRTPHLFGLGWLPAHDAAAAPNRWKSWQNGPKLSRPNEFMQGGREALRGAASLYKEDIKSSSPLYTKDNGANPPIPPENKPSLVHLCTLGEKLPPGWTTTKGSDGHVRITSPEGVGIPTVDDPLVGTPEQRAALAELKAWRKAAA
jgi:hypothetical protein